MHDMKISLLKALIAQSEALAKLKNEAKALRSKVEFIEKKEPNKELNN